jgi:hypothetical protein
MKNKIHILIAVVITVFFVMTLFAGCSARNAVERIGESAGGSADKNMTVSEEVPTITSAAEMAPSQDGDSSQQLYTQAGSSDASVNLATSTKLIKNGYIQVEVKEGEFEQVFFKVSSLAQKYKGYVSNSQTSSDPEGKMTNGIVTLRVEKENFDAVLNEIKEMGKVLNVNVNVQDVTQEYVDNDSRLKNLQSQQERLLQLMAQSTDVEDSVVVQKELADVESQIEVIKGRQNYLDNLIAYSTIEISISEPQAVTQNTEGGFLGAVKRGVRGALSFLRVATMVLIGISPLLVLAGIILLIIWQSLRAKYRRRARKALDNKTVEKK